MRTEIQKTGVLRADGIIRIRGRLIQKGPRHIATDGTGGRPVAAAVLLAQGHRARAALDAGATSAELTRHYRWSRSRLSQALALADGLAPDLQERIAMMTTKGSPTLLGERHLRSIAKLLDWREQRRQFDALLADIDP